MKKTCLGSVLLGCLSLAAFLTQAARADGAMIAQFKGYSTVNRVLEERLVREGQSFQLASYLDESFSVGSFGGGGLVDLLGTYGDSTLDSAFHNGQPNVANMVLWHVAFSGLSQDLGALCAAGPGPLTGMVQDALVAALKPVCAWPAASAKSDDALLGVWLAFMSFDAPMSEFEAWRDFFRGPAYAASSAPDAVAAMALAAFNNPYFLLRK